MTTDLLDADIPTETYSVHDEAGFDALPLGTHLEDEDGDRFEKVEGGYRAYGDAEPQFTHLYLTAPAVVLNPEVLGSFPLQAGDRATINDGAVHGFAGLAVQVLRRGVDGYNRNLVYVQPLNERPDDHGLCPFWWNAEEMTAFTPEPLTEGDRVRRISDQHFAADGDNFDYENRECQKGSVGTVTTNHGHRVSVTWDTGRISSIRASQLAPYVDPKPEPVFEDFEIEAGTYVQSQEGLDALPNLSIVNPLGSYLPIVKCGDGEWRSIGNVSGDRPTPRVLGPTQWVRERGGVVLFVPKNLD